MIKLKFLFSLLIVYYNFVNVHSFACPSNFFDCGNDRCIAHFWRCDGEDDCGNWADEHECRDLDKMSVKIPVKACPVNHTHCNDTHDTCVPNKWLCDGMDDCPDGADEKNCTTSSAKCTGFLCHSFECIPLRWKCDGIPDCDDGSDEDNCPKPKKNEICDKEHGFYQCFTGECIHHSKVCDNRKDCPQGDDEGMECRPTGCHLKNCSQSCFVAPEGPQCYCREGFAITSDNKTCVDKNECELSKKNGLCSQTCINLDGGYKCGCLDDYRLVNNKSCVAKEGEPLLLFSNSEGIRGLWLKTKRFFPVYHSLKTTVGIDYLGSEETVFWVDLDKEKSGVYSVDLFGENFKEVVVNGLKSPEDLAIDWIGKNLYITDAELNRIIVCQIEGHICTSQLFGQLDLPRAIVVDPSKGLVFWTEWGKHSGIYGAGMDGTDKTHLVADGVVWPNGLALDSVANRLYWSEAKFGKIEYYDFDIKLRKTVINDGVFHPFALSVFEDSLYWSDWITFSLDSCHKFSGHNQTTLLREVNEHIMGVHVFHPLTQKSSYNPCWFHTCSHLCVLAPDRKFTCACPDHLVLSDDNKTCVTAPEEKFVFVSVGQELKKVYSETIGNDVMIAIDIPKGIKVGDIAFDWKTKTLFAFDGRKFSIGSIGLENEINSFWTPIITSRLDRVEGLTYDSHTNNLYWLETREGILEVATVDGKSRAVLITGLDKPIDLALYPEHRRMYVAVMGNEPHIMVADMDGQNQKVLIASKNGFAVSLTIDKINNKLFWADPKNGIIEWLDIFAPNGHESKRGVVKKNLGHVMSVTVHNKTVFWTDLDSDILNHITLGVSSPRHLKLSLSLENKIKSEKKLLMAYSEPKPMGGCSEANSGCAHICLLGRFGPTCKCSFGYELEKDGQTCSKAIEVTDNSLLCNDCVTSGSEDFVLGFIQHENDEREDLNWFTDEDEDEEADQVFSRYDSKQKVNESHNGSKNNDKSSHVKNEDKQRIDVTTHRVRTEVTTKRFPQKQHKSKATEPMRKEKQDFEEKVRQMIFDEKPKNSSNKESIKTRTENSNNAQKLWLTMFVVFLVGAIIILLMVIVIKKEQYSEVRNVIYRRGDQMREAIVGFQNPIFKKRLGRTDEDEEPLNIDNKSLNGEKY